MRSAAEPSIESRVQSFASIPLQYHPGRLSGCYGRESLQETEDSVEEVTSTTFMELRG